MANEQEQHEIITPLVADQYWLVYAQAFIPAIKEAVTAGFQPDLKTGTPASVVESRFWAGLLQRAFTAGMRRGADIGVDFLKKSLEAKLVTMFPPRDGAIDPAKAEAYVDGAFVPISQRDRMSAGQLIHCMRNNHQHKQARGVIGDMTCGELLEALTQGHQCTSFKQCSDCAMLDCTECGALTQPVDVKGDHLVLSVDYRCGCVESECAREDVH